MNGIEHFRQAEQHLASAAALPSRERTELRYAEVHAALAQAAATYEFAHVLGGQPDLLNLLTAIEAQPTCTPAPGTTPTYSPGGLTDARAEDY